VKEKELFRAEEINITAIKDMIFQCLVLM
jgi:hypothetical protein